VIELRAGGRDKRLIYRDITIMMGINIRNDYSAKLREDIPSSDIYLPY
jgi:hypothetical protein